MKLNRLAQFVSLSCGSLAAIAAPVYATDNSEETVERIEVTGSRIKRIDMEGASPITTITADELAKSGFSTVGDALRSSNLNAFGSWGGGSNNGWGSQATVQLKGASAFHTLTLLDGKRMAKSPVMDGGAANINTIPMAAVERIEILTDGASAIYGTDAIAGVVNIILKKDFEGIQFDARMDRPTQEGGDSSNMSFTGGLDSEKGHLVFTVEHYESQKIMQKDRWYTRPFVKEGGNPEDYQDWVNISPTGRVLTQGAAGGWVYSTPFSNSDKSCADVYGGAFIGSLIDSDYPGDTLCAYDYTQAAATSVGQTRNNTLVHYSYELTDSIELTARAYWASNETKDISAPVPASISIPEGLPAYTTPEGLELVELLADPSAGMNYRFDTAGDRVAEHHDNIYDFLIGLDGAAEYFDWDVAVNYNKYDNYTWGTGYQLKGATTDLVGHWDDDTNSFIGWDPRDPNSELPPGATANYDKRMSASYLDINGGLSFNLFELPAGDVGMYVGASYREETLDSKVDALAEAGQIVGGNGGSGGAGERDVKAAYFEVVLPIIDNLELNLAGRYDDYSDFGGTFNPQVSIRYNVIDSLLLRGSWGTGFRAPTLSDLYQGTSEGFGYIKNYLNCYDEGEDIDSCDRWDYGATRTGGNEALKPEESESYNIGVVWEVTDDVNLSVDYWSLETTNLISELNASEIVRTQAKLWELADANGEPRPDVSSIYPGTSISQIGNGKIDYVVSQKLNVGLSEREGIDVKLGAGFDSDYGDFKFGLGWSYFLKYKSSYSQAGVQILSDDDAGREDTPAHRINLTADYSFGDHAVSYFGNYIGSQESWDVVEGSWDADAGETADDGQLYEIDSVFYHNLTYTYTLPWNNSISLGVTNLTDEDPKFRYDGTYNGNLYDIRGRTYWAGFRQSF
ncbi:TonB-dependent receptor [Shewanella insulae]|uniref:TonB-dependent receptor n=1 Tax=Shewanella insulae TaxID=2681496 RepID=A0A6L7HYJ4_9GAMM|nr:TonB-dependent receptor [Shewanella insulae]MCG9713137.1 TonB-dependent receptor [Shewanella insulae]MXR69335.1 TonB-dependent receptor [Shewanella insulae]